MSWDHDYWDNVIQPQRESTILAPRQARANTEIKDSQIINCKLPGLICTSAPRLTHPRQKANASRNLTTWEMKRLTPADWIRQLDDGRTITTGEYTAENGVYKHQKHLWHAGNLVFTDADKINGIKDETEGVDPFTDPQDLLAMFPTLEKTAFAISHSISSLSDTKPPPHVRLRIVFLTEHRITRNEYEDILQGLATQYPIISAGLACSQPVFGNAGWLRVYDNGKVVEKSTHFESEILSNTLSIDQCNVLTKLGKQSKVTEKEAPPTPRARNRNEYKGSLSDWLRKNGIAILGKRIGDSKLRGKAERLLVTCPWESHHTESFGDRDTAVFVDPASGKWSFNCFHTSFCGNKNWSDFREAVAPRREKPFYPPHVFKVIRYLDRSGIEHKAPEQSGANWIIKQVKCPCRSDCLGSIKISASPKQTPQWAPEADCGIPHFLQFMKTTGGKQ